ncbi:hypothetical protein HET73_01140 [Wolbachia endosymbiont of Atemnus politus]|uniref:hypothetical protein n=1 Tax=Wolbachia endosymbiont of Atemnus politus TaxID=2682840 RepID=UPI00157170D0|nr:hypothetical protein [Wolbachia endosymbiont of Atemnus politus]NSM56259.1 hypothetical protein [Wolbachia endosymbiont of Atemnus politus]
MFRLNANLRKFFADQGYKGKLQNRCLLETGCLKVVDVTGLQVNVGLLKELAF